MATLIVTHENRPIDITPVFDEIGTRTDAKIVALNVNDQKKLKYALKHNQAGDYDNVLVDLPFKYLSRQADAIRLLHNVIIYEEDGCQNFIENSKWKNKFLSFYKSIPHAKIIHTGHRTSQSFKSHGVNSYFVSKGFDGNKVVTSDSRNLPLAFIGALSSAVYEQRRQAVTTLKEELDLQVLKTSSTEEYYETLSRISVFFSADMGLGEYMAKNFEAMGAGCVLVAFKQGNQEEEVLGLKDMKNIVLYNTLEEALNKIKLLMVEKELCWDIAAAGKQHAMANFSFPVLGAKIYDILNEPPDAIPRKQSRILRYFKAITT